jgi:hypothetical protein
MLSQTSSHRVFPSSNLQTAYRETIISHQRTSGETDAGAFQDPDLNLRTNNEVEACRLPHRSQWTGISPVPPPNETALANAADQISQQVPQAEIPIPFGLIVALAANAVMPMINHLSMTQFPQYQEYAKSWARLLRVRLLRIEEAQNFAELAMRLQHLSNTVVLHREIITTERDKKALRSTIRVVEEMGREAQRER